MPLPISAFTPSVGGLDPLSERLAPGPAAPAGGASFTDALGQALASVDKLQLEGDRAAEKVALGGGNLHETALALEKADTFHKKAMELRDRVMVLRNERRAINQQRRVLVQDQNVKVRQELEDESKLDEKMDMALEMLKKGGKISI